MATNYDIINLALGDTFTERIPTATRTNLADVANAVLGYEPARNAFIQALINKIAMTLISKVEYTNPFAQFKGQKINFGDTIEDIYVDIVEGYEYDGNNTDPFGQSAPDVTAIYHTINSELQYKVTIKDAILRKAMRSEGGLSELIASIVDSLRTSADYDEYLETMKVLSNDGIYGSVVYLGAKTQSMANDSKKLLGKIKDVSSSLKFMSNKFNALSKNSNTPLNRQVLIIDSKYKDAIDLEVLSGIFNLSKAEIASRIIEVEGFVNNTSLVACLVDDRGFRIHNAIEDSESIRNPQGKYTNYYFNNWEVISWALFRNAVAFKFETAPTL